MVARLSLAGVLVATMLSVSSVHAGPDGDDALFYRDRFGLVAAAESSGMVVEPQTGALRLALEPARAGRRTGEYLSTPARAEKLFSAVLTSLDAEVPEGTELDVAFRFAPSRSGPWSSWRAASVETEIPARGLSRYLQFRVRMSSDDGVRSPRLRSVSALLGLLKEDNVPPGTHVELPRPEVTGREAWGARPARDEYTPHTPNRLIVHHSTAPTQATYAGARTIRGIQAFHMDDPRHRWIDIGYHFLVGPDGTIFEGRPETAVGAHCIPNSEKLGICVIGNFQPPSEEAPTSLQREKLVALLAHLAGKHAISAEGIKGHREYMTTDCPGQTLFDKLPELREEVAKRLAGK